MKVGLFIRFYLEEPAYPIYNQTKHEPQHINEFQGFRYA